VRRDADGVPRSEETLAPPARFQALCNGRAATGREGEHAPGHKHALSLRSHQRVRQPVDLRTLPLQLTLRCVLRLPAGDSLLIGLVFYRRTRLVRLF